MAELTSAVVKAVGWAVLNEGRPGALAQLAITLAKDIDGAAELVSDKPPPVAQLAKELRATLDDLEGLRDSDDAQSSLATVLSSPVWDGSEPGSPDTGTTRRKGGRKSG